MKFIRWNVLILNILFLSNINCHFDYSESEENNFFKKFCNAIASFFRGISEFFGGKISENSSSLVNENFTTIVENENGEKTILMSKHKLVQLERRTPRSREFKVITQEDLKIMLITAVVVIAIFVSILFLLMYFKPIARSIKENIILHNKIFKYKNKFKH